MTDTSGTSNDPTPGPNEGGAGVHRPDQKGADRPSETPAKPATGGDGASGGGGSDGFGTGT